MNQILYSFMGREDNYRLVNFALESVKIAGNDLRMFEGNSEVVFENGERSDFTTRADLSSLDFLVDAFQFRYPKMGIVAEGLEKLPLYKNRIDKDGKIPSTNGLYWVLDPLCGTIMHERGIDDFVISVGIYNAETEQAEEGVVYFPHSLNLVHSEGNHVVVKNPGKFSPFGFGKVSSRTDLKKQGLVSVEHKIVRENDVGPLANVIKRLRTAETCGGELALLACGKLDGVIKARQPMYDYLAGLALVQKAGGKVTDFEGNDIYMEPSNRKITDILATNGETGIHEELLKYTRSFKKAEK